MRQLKLNGCSVCAWKYGNKINEWNKCPFNHQECTINSHKEIEELASLFASQSALTKKVILQKLEDKYFIVEK